PQLVGAARAVAQVTGDPHPLRLAQHPELVLADRVRRRTVEAAERPPQPRLRLRVARRLRRARRAAPHVLPDLVRGLRVHVGDERLRRDRAGPYAAHASPPLTAPRPPSQSTRPTRPIRARSEERADLRAAPQPLDHVALDAVDVRHPLVAL